MSSAKAVSSTISWSAGVTSTLASGSSLAITTVPQAVDASVPLRTGSSRMCRSSTMGSCSYTRGRYSTLVDT